MDTGWKAVRGDVLAGLSLDENAEQHLRELVEVLDVIWKQTPVISERSMG
ncbi:UNVERIFIED_ORG: hypothetical protein ABIB52_003153 [Arthrobacter sp. UYCu721]